MGHRAQDRDPRDATSTPRYVRPWPESPGAACRHRRPSGTGQSHPRCLDNTPVLPNWSRISRESWSILVVLLPGPESPGTEGRPRRHSDRGPSRTRDLVDTAGTRTQARVTWRHGRPLDTGSRHLGHLVEPEGTRTRARVARDGWSTPSALGPGPETPGTSVRNCKASGTGPSHPGQVVDLGTSDQNPIRPAELVDTAGPRVPA